MDHKTLIEELAVKHNLTKKEVEEAVRSQSSLTEKVMRRGKAESVRWSYWGIFKVDPIRLKRFNKRENSTGLRQMDDE